MTTIINAQNNQAQDLFVTSYPSPRVPSLTSVGAEAVLTFDTTNVNVNTAASVDGATGQITLSSTSTVYQITAQAEINSNIPVTLKLVRSATGEQVGVAVPIQKQLSVVLQPALAGDYEIVAFTDSTQNFQYPNQIQRAQITVQDFASGGGGNPFDQNLNTTDSVTFASINVVNNSTTSTLYKATLSYDTTNPPVPNSPSLGSYPGSTKIASTQSGAGLVFETYRTSTGYKRWALTRSGNMVFPGAGVIYNDANSFSIDSGPGNFFQVNTPQGETLLSIDTSTGVTMVTDSLNNNYVWTFDNTGKSTLPGALDVSNTATTSTLYNAQVSWDTTNPPVPGYAALSSYPGATKFASTLSGAGVTIETFRTSTGIRKWHFSRAGVLIFPANSSFTDNALGATLNGPPDAPLSLADGNYQSVIELTTSTGIKLWTDWQTAVVPTVDVQTSAVSVNAPLSATTATITYINVAPVAQLRSQSSNFPFGLNTATILTVDSAVYNSGRLHVSVGGTLGLGSEAEHIQIDFITNGVTVVSTTSNLLTTTSPSLCSYAVSMSGTDVIVEVTNLDPSNFFPFEVNVMAELVANSIS